MTQKSARRAALSCALLATTAFCGLTAAPAAAQDSRRERLPQVYTMTPTGVNLQSGTFMHSETDLSIGSLNLVRSWRTVPTFDPTDPGVAEHKAFGGWNHNFFAGVKAIGTGNPDGRAVYADGKTYQFLLSSQFEWQPHNWDQHNKNALGTRLTGGGGGGTGNYVFRNHNGDVYTMNASALAERIDYADGTRLELSYDSAKRLRTVISNRGDAIVLDYGAHGHVATACGYNRATHYVDTNSTCAASSLKVSYGYTSGRLTSVTGLDNVTTNYQHDAAGNLSCLTVPGTNICRISMVSGLLPGENQHSAYEDQVRRQTMATGEVWSFNYVNPTVYDETPLQPGEIRKTWSRMIDPGGFTTVATYENGQLTSLQERSGTTTYAWSGLDPTEFTLPRGNKHVMTYDDRGNMTSHKRVAVEVDGVTAENLETFAAYPPSSSIGGSMPTGCSAASQKLCNKPAWTKDERGNQTDYRYDPAHGGVLSETGPAVPVGPAGTMARPQKRYVYEQRYAGVKNAAGAIVAAAAPVWLLVEERLCKTVGSDPDTVSPCFGTADEVRTVYEYGPSGSANALRLRGKVVDAGGRALRTCFAYDEQGNKISETSPRGTAGLSSCP